MITLEYTYNVDEKISDWSVYDATNHYPGWQDESDVRALKDTFNFFKDQDFYFENNFTIRDLLDSEKTYPIYPDFDRYNLN